MITLKDSRPLALQVSQLDVISQNYENSAKASLIENTVDNSTENNEAIIENKPIVDNANDVSAHIYDNDVTTTKVDNVSTTKIDESSQTLNNIEKKVTDNIDNDANKIEIDTKIKTNTVDENNLNKEIPVDLKPQTFKKDNNYISQVHIAIGVKEGDTIESICNKYGYNVPEFLAYNHLAITTTLLPGMLLLFPQHTNELTIAEEEIFDNICNKLKQSAKFMSKGNTTLSALNDVGELQVEHRTL